MRKLLFIIVFLLITQPLFAQENWVLVQPTTEAYIQAINVIFTNPDNNNWEVRQYLRNAVVHEFQMRGWDVSQLSYDAIETLYIRVFDYGWEIHRNDFFGTIDNAQWLMFQIYLREQAVDLDSIETLTTDVYTLDIQHIDFNGDGVDELLLDIRWHEASYHAFWILEYDTAGYRRVDTPQLWFSETCNFRSACGGAGIIYLIGDVNADELPELAVAVGSYCGYGECGGHLLLMAWRNDSMIEIAKRQQSWDLGWTGVSGGGGSPILPADDLWTFRNVDDDAPLELIQHRIFEDNRGCIATNDRNFDWYEDEDAYISGIITETYTNSASCALREGQIAMMSADYERAARAYAHAVDLLVVSESQEDRDAMVYAQSELIIALVLAGREAESIRAIEILSGMQPLSDFTTFLKQAVIDYDPSELPIVLCSQVVDALTYMPGTDAFIGFFPNYAELDDVPARPDIYTGGASGPTYSGCDPTRYVQKLIEIEPMSTDISPQSQLEARGIYVADAVSFDINTDGMSDWIIRSDYVQPNLFLLSDEENYQFSMTPAEPFGEKIQYIIDELPHNAGQVLVISAFYDPDTPCKPSNSSFEPVPGRLSIYRLIEDHILSPIASMVLCQPVSLDEIDVMSGEISAWGYTSAEYVPTTWLWNSEIESFEDIRLPSAQHTEDIDYPFSCGNSQSEFCGFYETDPQAILDTIDILFANLEADNSYTDTFLQSVTYYRALALEQLNLPDEALIEYMALYESYPDSLWGQMAHIHLGAGAIGG